MSISFRRLCAALLGVSLGASLSVPASAGERVGGPSRTQAAREQGTDRLIVRLRDPVASDPDQRIRELSGRTGEPVRRLRGMSGGAHVVLLPTQMSIAAARAAARRLASDASVAYAEADVRVYPQRVPNDSLYPQQWHYFDPVAGINLPAAWDVTIGDSSIVVAVLDTGIVNHADLAAKLVPGYDFIGDIAISNDGNGRDANASDPGDYGCDGAASSWHGTHVAGTIGASTNNGTGVAGVNWSSRIQSIRVLGRCGGYTSDVIDGMRWAAGIAVAGTPGNATPSRVINMSFGGQGACGTSLQNAINDVTARGVVVVAAAGNDNVDVATFTPAACAGVIAVAATGRSGEKASFSNYGSRIAIAAPGAGGTGILSTLNSGSTTPGADSYASYQGTSMAAPHVSGVVSLMLSANAALTPAQVLQQLRSSTRPFPVGTGRDCLTTTCGAGIVDAAAALGAPTSQPPPSTGRVNLALASNGAQASASSTYSASYPPSGVINGERRGSNWAAGGGWNDATPGAWPAWLQVDLGAVRTVAEIDVFTVQDTYANPQEPTETMTFTHYGITDFEVQHWTGSAWQTVQGGSVTGNNKVWRKFTFPDVSTRFVRVLIVGSTDGFSRLTELEAYATADAPATGTVNFAALANGGVASASSAYAGYPASAVNNGDRRGVGWGSGGGWNDATGSSWPDVVQVDFSGVKSITEIDVFSIQDAYANPQEPAETSTFSQYGVTDFDLQYWTGSAWAAVPGGSIRGNDKVWRKVTFAAISTSAIRVVVLGGLAGYSRLVEIEAWGTPSGTSTTNVAAQANGGSATASSAYAGYPASAVNNGDRRGLGWGSGGGWNDATGSGWPDVLQIDFSGVRSIVEIDVFTVQDAYASPQEPTDSLTFTQYGVTDFDLQYWTGSAWAAVPGGSIRGNDKVWRKVSFSALSTSAIRVVVVGGLAGYSRIVEVEAYAL